jgi:hypothetical protein
MDADRNPGNRHSFRDHGLRLVVPEWMAPDAVGARRRRNRLGWALARVETKTPGLRSLPSPIANTDALAYAGDSGEEVVGEAKTVDSFDLFFEPPESTRRSPPCFSTLHLLRRDISVCFGVCPVRQIKLDSEAIWTGTMGILAGLDLVAKFAYGSDANNNTRKRFRWFLTKFMRLTPHDAETIYQLRNSMLLSFGLVSKTKTRTYHFVLDRKNPHGKLIAPRGTDGFLIDAWVLLRRWESSLSEYRRRLFDPNDKDGLIDKFKLMFPEYGGPILIDEYR